MINDVIHFNFLIDTPFLDKLKIRMSTPTPVQTMIRQLIKIYCNCFVEDGVKIPILGFEFLIDTGKHTCILQEVPLWTSREPDNYETT